ncbi:hypothetical protein Taro_027243 [Colocasia esculenta]|uniref:Uncharacterized protein n=1 Tax=Colocasia esculenta TaxID=4460 RepID=A0A843VTS0_COLES|nr:hypothetical protein [Colocasia esculenta]
MATDSSSGQSRGGVKSSPGSSGGEAVGVQKPAATCSEAYKPAAEPSCSQCGKPFKPERLHAHMKSCRALRNQRKRMSSEKLRTKEAESHRAMLSEEASSLFLLSH